MQVTTYLPAFIGGLMMGIALLMFFVSSTATASSKNNLKSRVIGLWPVIVAFTIGVPLGSMFIGHEGIKFWAAVSLLTAGLVIAAITTFIAQHCNKRK